MKQINFESNSDHPEPGFNVSRSMDVIAFSICSVVRCGAVVWAERVITCISFMAAAVAIGMLLPPFGSVSAQEKSDAPLLAVQTSHSGDVDALSISSDGTLLASSSSGFFGDHTVRVWNINSGRKLWTLRGHKDHAAFGDQSSGLCFTAGGRNLLSASYDPLLIAYDLSTGQTNSVPKHKIPVGAVAFTSDGSKLAFSGDLTGYLPSVGKEDYTVKIMDLKTGKIQSLKGHSAAVQSLVFSSNGNVLYSGSADKSIIEWDVNTRKRKRTLSGATRAVRGLAISPDGKWLASVQKTYNFEALGPVPPVLTLWNLNTGKPIDSLSGYTTPIQFSPKSNKLGVADDTSKSLTLIDVLDRTKKEVLPLATPLHALTFNPVTGSIVFASNNEVAVINPGDISRKIVFGGQINPVNAADLSNSGKQLAIGEDGGLINLWDLQDGIQNATLTEFSNQKIALSEISDRLLGLKFRGETELWAGTIGGMLGIWNISDAESHTLKSFKLKESYGPIYQLDASTKGMVPMVRHSGRVVIWNGDTHQVAYEIPEPDSNSQVNAGAIRSDGAFAVTGHWQGTVALWDIQQVQQEPKMIWKWPRGEVLNNENADKRITALSFSPNNALIAVGRGDSTITILDAASGSTKLLLTGHKDLVNRLQFSPDSKQLISGSWDNTAKIWDVNSGNCRKTLSWHTLQLRAVAFMPDGKHVLTASEDGTARIWDSSTGEGLINLISIHNSGQSSTKPLWIAVTDDGLFDGTADGMRYVGWRIPSSNEVVGLESFYNEYFRPGLLTEILEGKRPKADFNIAAKLRFPGLYTLARQGLAHIEQRDESTYLCLAQAASNNSSENVKVLGRGTPIELTKDYTKDESNPSCTYRFELPSDGGPYELVGKTDEWKPKSAWSNQQIVKPDTTRSTLHVFTVGINHYEQENNNTYAQLRFPVADADAVEAFFREQKKSTSKMFSDIHIWEGLREDKATQKNIRDRIPEMAKNVKEDDVVFMFFSGHGRVPPGQSMFYFIPYFSAPQAFSFVDEREIGLSTAMLAEAIRNLPARRIVLVIDACQSGGAIESLAKVGEIKIAVEERRAALEKASGKRGGSYDVGVYILAAATPVQEAAEPIPGTGVDNWKHGLLTSALLDVLEGRDMASSGSLRVRDLMDRVNKRLLRLANERQWIQTPFFTSVGNSDFSVAQK